MIEWMSATTNQQAVLKNLNWQQNRLHHLWQIGREEQGAAIVYFAVVLTFLIAMAGIAVDGSNAYSQRRLVQTAADAAALAGARALALDQGLGQADIDINDLATANGADTVTWAASNGNKNVEVFAAQAMETYFIRLFGINTITVSAVAEAGFVPAVPPELVPMTVSCDCLEHEQKILEPPDNKYCVNNAHQSDLNVDYGIWLRGIDPLYPSDGYNHAEWHYKIQSNTGVMMEYADGTAHITAIVKNQDGHGFEVDYTLTGHTLDMPPGSPKIPGYAYNASTWYYYTSLSGQLRGLPGGRYNGAVINISAYGPTFQIGVGANMWDPFEFGGAAWYDTNVATQPTTGVVLKNPEKGDINIRLQDCSDDLVQDETNSTNCDFAWLDWDGGSSTQEELRGYIEDTTLSGVKQIGDTIAAGVDAFSTLSDGLGGGLSLAVNATLDELLGQELTIPLYDRTLSTEEEYVVCGFGIMVIQEYNIEENPKWFKVDFKPWVIRGDSVDEDAPDYGVRDIKLYQ